MLAIIIIIYTSTLPFSKIPKWRAGWGEEQRLQEKTEHSFGFVFKYREGPSRILKYKI